jgi:hypothetical protein
MKGSLPGIWNRGKMVLSLSQDDYFGLGTEMICRCCVQAICIYMYTTKTVANGGKLIDLQRWDAGLGLRK